MPAFIRLLVFGAISFCFPCGGRAFNPPRDTAGPISVEIADPGEIVALEKPIAVPVSVRNAGLATVTGTVAIAVTDSWRIDGKSGAAFSLAAGCGTNLPFTITAGRGTHAALYPLHARIACSDASGAVWNAHPILIMSVSPGALEPTVAEPSPIQVPIRGPLRLDERGDLSHVTIAVDGQSPVKKAAGWTGADSETGAGFSVSDADRGKLSRSWNIHPPYRRRWGDVWVDHHVALPDAKPIFVRFATAIRDHDPSREGASDGVDFRVEVGEGGKFENRFKRFSASNVWEPAEVDISSYAGRQVTLRFITGPGPAHNTSCDSCFWAEPSIWVGPEPPEEAAGARNERGTSALIAARNACRGDAAPWSWRIEGTSGAIGASVVGGRGGITDAFVAFSDGKKEIVFDGFEVEIGGTPVGGRNGLPITAQEGRFDSAKGELSHDIIVGDREVKVLARIWQQGGALRMAFSMAGVERDRKGEPRFSRLALGSGSEAVRRVYAGFGNVIQDPGPKGFELRAGGFTLSTRHIGSDYANGISVVQATDVFPDALVVKPALRRCSLIAHHDATFTLVPSTRGAFEAARTYRDLAGFKAAGGVGGLLNRMCIDQWGGDYGEAAAGIEDLARYAVTNAVFVKHVWQRWGYDYRLPEIYPPAGDAGAFLSLAAACRKAGILFAPHDNYIDFYPDAEGFSYKHIMFGRNGAPQKAWFNEGRKAQSYRWLPTAFFPWLEANLNHVKKDIGATSYFVDVFSAIPPLDYHDHAGRFYPKMICQEGWGAAFDRIREILGGGAPTISEAGHDGLIGHLDAAEADHNGWSQGGVGGWHIAAGDGERVPWHDMASHGAFVLFAGGLGHRYAGKENDQMLHGYGSDDYLNMTVLGGRNPMCDGPFSRRTVMTYWLLHDVCAGLARAQMTGHQFIDDNIHRQVVRFSGDGLVCANRGESDWEVEGKVLPQYGFLARSGAAEASVTRRDGIISGFASAPGLIFADARPPSETVRPVASASVKGFEDLGGGKFRLTMGWATLGDVDPRARIFTHFDHAGKDRESIAFQATLRPNHEKLLERGNHSAICEAGIPGGQKLPATFLIRCGVYVPVAGGARLKMADATDAGGRARCGKIIAARQPGSANVTLRWEAEGDPWLTKRKARLNHERKVVDFETVATSGAFKLETGGPTWWLTPLPHSDPFDVRLRTDKLGVGDGKACVVTAIGMKGETLGDVAVLRHGNEIAFRTTEGPFQYRITFPAQ